MQALAGAAEHCPGRRSLQTPALSRVSGGRLRKMGQRPSLLPAGWGPRVSKSIWLFPITEVQNSALYPPVSLPSPLLSPLTPFPPLLSSPLLSLLLKKNYETSKILSLHLRRLERTPSPESAGSLERWGHFLCFAPLPRHPDFPLSGSAILYVAKFYSLDLLLWGLSNPDCPHRHQTASAS